MLTTTQAAQQLGVTRTRVTQMIWEGKISAQKIGRDYLIEESALEAVRDRPGPGNPNFQRQV